MPASPPTAYSEMQAAISTAIKLLLIVASTHSPKLENVFFLFDGFRFFQTRKYHALKAKIHKWPFGSSFCHMFRSFRVSVVSVTCLRFSGIGPPRLVVCWFHPSCTQRSVQASAEHRDVARMVHGELLKQLEAAHRQFEEIDIDHSGKQTPRYQVSAARYSTSSPLFVWHLTGAIRCIQV
jgi:hypothetical protein